MVATTTAVTVPPLTFASTRIRREWSDGRLDRRVREIVLDAAAFLFAEFGRTLELGSIYRTPAEEAAIAASTGKPTSFIHPAWRAVDGRQHNLTPGMVAAVTAWIGSRWIYDPTRPEKPVCYTAPHGTGPHLHFQAHPLTRRRS